MKAIKYSVLGILCLSLFSCAFGQKINYALPQQLARPNTSKSLFIVVAEDRPYVLSGNKTRQWVGLLRSNAGIPYGVHTSSGSPFVQDVLTLLTSSLGAQGLAVGGKTLLNGSNQSDLSSIRAEAEGKTVLSFSIKEWKTDQYRTAALHYDIELSVMDKNMKPVATEKASGKETLNGLNPSRVSAIAALSDILGNLLKRSSIESALNQTAVIKLESEKINNKISRARDKEVKVTNSPSACSSAQVLTLKSNGLSSEQIYAMCGR